MPLRESFKSVLGGWWPVMSTARHLDREAAQVVARTARTMAAERLRGKKVVIVFVEEPGFVQFLLPIVKQLKHKAGDAIAWYIATDYPDVDSAMSPFDVPRERRFSPSLAPLMLPANVFLSASVYGNGPPLAHCINVSHNQPTKFEAYPKEYLENYDTHFLTGPLHREQYEHMFEIHQLDMGRFRLLDVGYPKSDALLQGAYDRRKVLESLHLKSDRQTVVYAPAWDAGGSLRSFGEQVIEQLLSVPDVNVIAKLHPVSHTPPTSPNFEFYTGGVDWTERLAKFAGNQRFKHVTDFQADPLLQASDLLVTDFSSVALEFIVLDKPVIYLDCPEYFEKTLKTPGYTTDPDYVKNDPRANAGRHVGVVVDQVENLATAVTAVLADPTRNSAQRHELSARLLYNPGKGAEVAAETILKMVGLKPA